MSSGLLPLVERGLYLTHPRRGIIHVGANDGAEIGWYLDRGLSPVLCFEPNPAAFKRGEAAWSDQPEVTFIPCALGDENGAIALSVPEDGDDEKTSRYQPIPTEGHDWTLIPAGDSLSVPVVRFDFWMHGGHDLTPYGTLVVDVQGMEYEVLEGFGIYLQAFDYLCVELSEKPVYDGEAPAGEVVAFLTARGFRQESDIEEHGDVLFSRE